MTCEYTAQKKLRKHLTHSSKSQWKSKWKTEITGSSKSSSVHALDESENVLWNLLPDLDQGIGELLDCVGTWWHRFKMLHKCSIGFQSGFGEGINASSTRNHLQTLATWGGTPGPLHQCKAWPLLGGFHAGCDMEVCAAPQGHASSDWLIHHQTGRSWCCYRLRFSPRCLWGRTRALMSPSLVLFLIVAETCTPLTCWR